MPRFSLQLTDEQIGILSCFHDNTPERNKKERRWESLELTKTCTAGEALATLYPYQSPETSGLSWNERIEEESKYREKRGRKKERIIDILRDLYGIISIHHSRVIWHYFIPPGIYPLVQNAIKTGVFEREFSDGDLYTLGVIYRRSQELRNMRQHKRYGNPRFHPTEVSKLNLKDKESTIKSLDNLVGILAVSLIWDQFKPENTPEDYSPSFKIRYDRKRWFLPYARLPDAKKLLGI